MPRSSLVRTIACSVVLATLLLAMTGNVFAAKEKITLMVHWPTGSSYYRLLLEYISEYNSMQDSVEIELISAGTLPQLVEKLSVGIAAGVPPQAVNVIDMYVERFESMIFPLPPVVTEKMTSFYLPVALNGATYRGKVIGFPTEVQFAGLIYNTVHFAESGIPNQPPTTWDEFIAFAKKLQILKDDRVERYGATVVSNRIAKDIGSYVYSQGSELITQDGKPLFNSVPVVQAVEALRQGVIDRIFYFGGHGDANGGFAAQRAAMVIQEPWVKSGLANLYPAEYQAGQFRVSHSPYGQSGKAFVWPYTYTWSIIKTDKTAETLQFLEWLNLQQTKDRVTRMGNILANLGSFPATRVDLMNQPIMKDILMRDYMAALEKYDFIRFPNIPGASAGQDILRFAVTPAMTGKTPVRDSLELAQLQFVDELNKGASK